jgi:hypothetical protein
MEGWKMEPRPQLALTEFNINLMNAEVQATSNAVGHLIDQNKETEKALVTLNKKLKAELERLETRIDTISELSFTIALTQTQLSKLEKEVYEQKEHVRGLDVIATPFAAVFGILVLMHGGLFGYILCRVLVEWLNSPDPPLHEQTPVCSVSSRRRPKVWRAASRLRTAED